MIQTQISKGATGTSLFNHFLFFNTYGKIESRLKYTLCLIDRFRFRYNVTIDKFCFFSFNSDVIVLPPFHDLFLELRGHDPDFDQVIELLTVLIREIRAVVPLCHGLVIDQPHEVRDGREEITVRCEAEPLEKARHVVARVVGVNRDKFVGHHLLAGIEDDTRRGLATVGLVVNDRFGCHDPIVGRSEAVLRDYRVVRLDDGLDLRRDLSVLLEFVGPVLQIKPSVGRDHEILDRELVVSDYGKHHSFQDGLRSGARDNVGHFESRLSTMLRCDGTKGNSLIYPTI